MSLFIHVHTISPRKSPDCASLHPGYVRLPIQDSGFTIHDSRFTIDDSPFTSPLSRLPSPPTPMDHFLLGPQCPGTQGEVTWLRQAIRIWARARRGRFPFEAGAPSSC